MQAAQLLVTSGRLDAPKHSVPHVPDLRVRDGDTVAPGPAPEVVADCTGAADARAHQPALRAATAAYHAQAMKSAWTGSRTHPHTGG